MRLRNRRLRTTQNMRNLTADVQLNIAQMIYPLFIEEGENIRTEIPSMPGQYRISTDRLEEELEELDRLGIKNLLLFGIPARKDEQGSEAFNPDGVVQQAIRKIRCLAPESLVITDVCMCEYTANGQCGIVRDGYVENDITLAYLAKIALSHAEAGADMVAPSDMMDHRVAYIRDSLDEAGFTQTSIMAYSVKYDSAYYGPFRDAADSAPKEGNRKSYQMDYRRSKEPLSEALQDMDEGADIIMVKPALAYLDVIKMLSSSIYLPLAAYNVSGEYSMVKAAAAKEWIDERAVVMENMYAIRRAGAEIIISYHAKDVARWTL